MERVSYKYLSPRQVRVAQMLAKGYSNKAIALNLDCCLTVAQKDVRNVMLKYGARTRIIGALMIVGALPAKGVMAELDRPNLVVADRPNLVVTA
jgi:DNA-binding CsgD family transcriptional regulator